MSCIISEIKRDIGRESRFFIPCFRRPHLGVQSEYCHNVWQEKLEWCGCPTVKNVWWYVCQLFSTRYTNVTDRRTDRHRKNHTHRSVNTHTVLISLLITWPEVVAWRRSFWSKKDTSKWLGGLGCNNVFERFQDRPSLDMLSPLCNELASIIIARQHTDARTRDIDIANLSVRYVPVSDENGLTYRHSFFTVQ